MTNKGLDWAVREWGARAKVRRRFVTRGPGGPYFLRGKRHSSIDSLNIRSGVQWKCRGRLGGRWRMWRASN
jgi:hypothetical protein